VLEVMALRIPVFSLEEVLTSKLLALTEQEPDFSAVLELARALAIQPRLLLLDEPSSGLGESETETFGDLLRVLALDGRAVLMVEHDMDLVMRVCDVIHVLDFGQVIATGTPAEIRSNPKVMQAYLGTYADVVTSAEQVESEEVEAPRG